VPLKSSLTPIGDGGRSLIRTGGLIAALLVLLVVGSMTVSACTVTVESGYAGIKQTKFGSNPGVQLRELGPGLHWEGFGEKIRTYPTRQRTYSYTREANADGNENEEIEFAAANGLPMTADVALTFKVQDNKAADLYATWRQDFDELLDGQIRNDVRAAIAREAEKMPISCSQESLGAPGAPGTEPAVPAGVVLPPAPICDNALIGPGRQLVMARALASLQRQWGPQGVTISRMEWVGNIRYPEVVRNAIQARSQAEQDTLAAQAAVAKAKANAEAEVAVARGKAESTRLVAESLRANPEIVQLRAVERNIGPCPTNANTCVIGANVNLAEIMDQRRQ
jgi:regulator of protease activity HflC (stomatin/prohibitin superfamily)